MINKFFRYLITGILWIILTIFLLAPPVFSAGNNDFNIQSLNINQDNYLLIGTGQEKGNSQIGEWVDIKTIPELRGSSGTDGQNGLNGLNGLNGINGKDFDPAEVNRLDSRIDEVSDRVGELEKTQYVIHTELKFIREKHLEVGIYTEYNIGRNCVSEIGLNITIPIGESYLDRENTQIKARLDRLEQILGTSEMQESIERTKMNKLKVNTDGKSIWIGGKF